MSTKKASNSLSSRNPLTQSHIKPEDAYTYLKWTALLCLVLALFGLGIFLVGYKDLSIGRGVTLGVLLLVSCISCIGAFTVKRKLAQRK